MCLAVPARIVEIKGKYATVDILGAVDTISIELLKQVEVGEYVIVHAGCAITKIDAQEAQETICLFRELGEISKR